MENYDPDAESMPDVLSTSEFSSASEVLSTSQFLTNNNETLEPEGEGYIKNPEIDKLTLELFMNKQKYKKYVEKTDPKKHSEIQSHYSDIRKYRGAILNMTEDFLNRPDMQITTELGEIFDAYSRTLIRYFKNKELEKTTSFEKEQEDEDDIMLGTIDETPTTQPTMNSFWSGETVIKKQSNKKDISQFGNFIPRR
jgi:hypothetical protein